MEMETIILLVPLALGTVGFLLLGRALIDPAPPAGCINQPT